MLSRVAMPAFLALVFVVVMAVGMVSAARSGPRVPSQSPAATYTPEETQMLLKLAGVPGLP